MERVHRFIQEHPTASSLEITLATGCVNVTGRVSDLRAAGIDVRCAKRNDGVDGYRVVTELTLFGLAS